MTDRKEDESSLFIFSFSECSLMDLYRVTSPAVSEKEPKATLSDLEEACNLYLQERLVKSIQYWTVEVRTNFENLFVFSF